MAKIDSPGVAPRRPSGATPRQLGGAADAGAAAVVPGCFFARRISAKMVPEPEIARYAVITAIATGAVWRTLAQMIGEPGIGARRRLARLARRSCLPQDKRASGRSGAEMLRVRPDAITEHVEMDAL